MGIVKAITSTANIALETVLNVQDSRIARILKEKSTAYDKYLNFQDFLIE